MIEASAGLDFIVRVSLCATVTDTLYFPYIFLNTLSHITLEYLEKKTRRLLVFQLFFSI